MKFDMHCHTAEGSLDAKISIADYIKKLKKLGFDGMLVSDHNSYKGYRYWAEHLKKQEKDGFVVLKGIEYDTIDAGHMLIVMPEKVDLKILELRGLPVLLLIEIVHRHGGIIGPAHPCGERYLSITNTRKHRNQLMVMDRFDFIEGFNACEETEDNVRAREIAKEYKKPVTGGSDAHRQECVGKAYTEFTGEIHCESDLIRLIKTKGRYACKCGGERFYGTTKDKLGRANSLLVQSFWFYNKICGMARSRKRRREIKRMYIKIK